MRSPAEMDILVIDITNRCFLACSNCTRDVAHQTHTREMTPDTFRKALASLKPWWKPGRVIGLIGGEPTLNKHFAEICRIFRDEFNPGALKLGRKPIRHMDQFAHDRLFDRTNGKGLWTSFGPRFMDHFEDVLDTFSHWNANDHSQGGKHQTALVDAREMCEALGIPWSEWPKYRDTCWVQNSWSASITPRGKAYFCERAAQLDELYNDGKLGWDIEAEPDWWKRRPDQFGEQLSICERCSLALPGPSQVDALDRDIIGKSHRIQLELIGSPAVKGGRFEEFDPAKHIERRTIETRDNYIAPSCVRVSDDNPHLKPKKLTAVVVCVGRAEQLRETLAWNAKLVDELVVVTDTLNESTKLGNVRFVASTRFREMGHAFNKGKMINDALTSISNPDWILLTDADVFLSPKLPEFMRTHAINPGVLYGTHRYDINPKRVADFKAGRNAGSWPAAVGVNLEPNGYFQLFNRRAHAIRARWPAVMSESFCSAGGVDSWFLQQFPADKRCVVPQLAVVHIAHAKTAGADWNGERRPGTWRQCAMLTGRGPIWTENIEIPARLRLTDTLHGESVEVEFDGTIPTDTVCANGDGGLMFNGRDIGGHHVHVAYFFEGAPALV